MSGIEVLRGLPAVLRSTPPLFSTTLAAPNCKVPPLSPIEEADAVAFENGNEASGVIDLSGLRPAMARALEKFRRMVLSAGGTFDLKSAYRPPAYQAHLQDVWFKWMELRNNRTAGCQALRAHVADEFSRHLLMETQKPVTFSDHTLGLAFDAAVVLPRAARQRRRVSLDRLAVLAGLTRPDIHRDPVHFKLVTGRGGLHG
ncbi:MAG: hypothetical protein P4L56_21480 [Candidatus Sulfopaludibacter sp.]|nr:hypothetical protein [Candidatus Sulfopaludibacter sp.]